MTAVSRRDLRGYAWYVAPAVAYAAAIFVGGSLHVSAAPKVAHGDKIVHALAFAGMALLAYRAVRFQWSTTTRTAQLVWGAAVSGALGGLLEIYQAFIPFRSADVLDWLADLVGAAIAMGVAHLMLRRRTSAAVAPDGGAVAARQSGA